MRPIYCLSSSASFSVVEMLLFASHLPFLLHRWLSLGNQLNGVRLVDEGLRARYKAAYPDVEVQPPSPPRTSGPMDAAPTSSQKAAAPDGGERPS